MVRKSQVESAYQILYERIERMKVGERLPPFAALIRELSFSQATLSKAYDRLEAEGFITRRNRLGVYVSDPKASGEMAVVMQAERLREGSSPYYRNVMAGINEALGALNTDWRLKVHVGQPVQELEMFPATLDLDAPDLRGVFTFEPLFEMEQVLADRGIPIVGVLPRPGRCWVGYDRDDFIVRCVEYLSDTGCRSIGTIGALSLKRSAPVSSIRDAV